MLRDWVYLQDILNAARLAMSYVEGVSKEVFLQDTQLQDSVSGASKSSGRRHGAFRWV